MLEERRRATGEQGSQETALALTVFRKLLSQVQREFANKPREFPLVN